MRTHLKPRTTRTLSMAAAAAALVLPASALALSGVGAAAATAPLQATVSPRVSHLGRYVTVSGTIPGGTAGQRAVLQSAGRSTGPWRAIQTGVTRAGGRVVFRARPRHSAYLRIVAGRTQVPASTVQATPAFGVAPVVSAPQRVVVAARFALGHHDLAALSGQMVKVGGALTPARRGRVVRVQARQAGRWQTVSRTRTRANGHFTVRFAPDRAADRRLRFVFAGDRGNGGTTQGAGRLAVFSPDLASWYQDAGSTACGFHATYGVANRSLPCGTKVKIRYGGRTVTATVDDRGPYVGGRDWDLSQTTAGALGFGGVGTIWVSL